MQILHRPPHKCSTSWIYVKEENRYYTCVTEKWVYTTKAERDFKASKENKREEVVKVTKWRYKKLNGKTEFHLWAYIPVEKFES